MKKNEKLTDYFNAAKNNGAEFTQDELQRIVENYSDEKELGLNFTNTKNWKGILFMFTLASTFVTCIIGIIMGIGISNETIPVKTIQSKIFLENNNSKQIAQKISDNKNITPITENPQIQDMDSMVKNATIEKPTTLNIAGITSITLKKDELAKLGISTNKDCGITISGNGIATTYHILNNNNKLHYYDVHHIKTPLDTILGVRNKSLGLDKDSNGIFTSVSSIHLDTKSTVKKALPLLVTGTDGRILSDHLGSQITEKDTSLAQKDAAWLDSHNPEHKPTMIFYLEPKDSLMTNEQIKQAMGDTSNTLVIFRRLTVEQSEEIKNAQVKRKNEINEYLKLDKLIAIKVETDCRSNAMIFWYEFQDLKKELPYYFIDIDQIDQIVQKHDTVFYTLKNSPVSHPVPLEERPKTGCKYSDICRTSSGAVLETNVFPNPANESINLKFILNDQRKCSFSLHDLNGTYIKELSDESVFPKGEHTKTLDIHEVEAGIYLLSMITDKKERVVQRVIIKK